MKYSVNGGKIYKLPASIKSQHLDSYEVAEAIANFWFWDNFDSQGTQPEEYTVKLYTDEEILIRGYQVVIDYSPSFNAYLLEDEE